MRRTVGARGLRIAVVAGSLSAGLVGTVYLAAAPAGASITAPATVRVSAGSGDSGGRELPAMSADGRYEAFVGRSSASQGVYVFDRRTGATTQLTTANDMNTAISGDGRYVAFVRYGASRDVYLLDRQTGVSTLQSVTSSGVPASGGSGSDFPSVSGDGRYVAFQSAATNLGGPSASGGPNKVYVHDNVTGTTVMVSLTSTGGAPDGNATFPAITPDGRYVAFESDAANLLPNGVTSTSAQIYLHDTTGGVTSLVSRSTDGVVGDGTSGATYGPSVSADGQLVAFESDATNLVAGDTNGATDAFVHDMATGTTVRVSVTADGAQAVPPPPPAGITVPTTPVAGAGPRISGDGTTVAFESEAALVVDDTNGVKDVYTNTLATAAVERCSVPAPGGTEATGTRVDGQTGDTVANSNGADAAVGSDGRYVAFTSAGDLSADRPAPVPPETTFEPAVFVRTRNVPTVTGVSPGEVGLARTDVSVTVTGTNFTQPSAAGDLTVSFGPGVTEQSVTWISSTELLVRVDVAWNATLGNRVIVVTNPGSDIGSLTSGFTVVPRGSGYRFASADGGVFGFGDAGFHGSMGGTPLNEPIVGMAESNTGDGYWLVASDGGVFAFGDATFQGSLGSTPLNEPIVGMAASPSGAGYWLVASDGGVFAFGDATFQGSLGSTPLNEPIVGMAGSPSGGGYWLVASDGGVFAYGDAGYRGSMGGTPLNEPIVGMAAVPTGGGYWTVASDGGVFAFGSATFLGSTGGTTLNQPIVAMTAD